MSKTFDFNFLFLPSFQTAWNTHAKQSGAASQLTAFLYKSTCKLVIRKKAY